MQKITITFEINRHPSVTDEDLEKIIKLVTDAAPGWYEIEEEDFLARKFLEELINV